MKICKVFLLICLIFGLALTSSAEAGGVGRVSGDL